MPDDLDSNLTHSPANNSTEIAPSVIRELDLQQLRNSLRPGQQNMADWQGGELAVSAVPGAGKSHSMAVAAALAIAREQLHSRRQLIVVTLTRSAAANIKLKIREFLKKELRLPQIGFTVNTLHGLALNIASRHQQLSGLNLESSTLVLPTPSHRLMRTCVEQWIVNNPRRYAILLEGMQFDGEETERLRRQSVLRTEVLPNLAHTVIREAKSSGLLPDHLWELAERTPCNYGILAISAGLYEQYQRLLKMSNYIDYDEMILGALRVLDNADVRKLWQKQVFAVFEDEAQDSSLLQSRLLEILATNPENEKSNVGVGLADNLTEKTTTSQQNPPSLINLTEKTTTSQQNPPSLINLTEKTTNSQQNPPSLINLTEKTTNSQQNPPSLINLTEKTTNSQQNPPSLINLTEKTTNSQQNPPSLINLTEKTTNSQQNPPSLINLTEKTTNSQQNPPSLINLTEKPTTSQQNSPSSRNLVRVGDPNQAINSTFTAADPKYFQIFCKKCDEKNRLARMQQAGRSTQIIIDAANFVLGWVSEYVSKKIADDEKLNIANQIYSNSSFTRDEKIQNDTEMFWLQNIYPVNPGDPQINPEPTGKGLEIYTPRDIYDTVDMIGERVISLFSDNPEANAAVLVRENRQARFVAQKLEDLQRQHGLKIYEVGESDRHSLVPSEILKLLQFIDRPHSPDNLKAALEVIEKRGFISKQDFNALATLPEQFLYPGPLDPPQTQVVKQARRYCCDLLQARLELPLYHLPAFLASEILKYDKTELATAEKLAERIAQQTYGNLSMSAILSVLKEIVGSEQFEAVETEDSDSRYVRKGQLTIITMHKAKGLDWDYVFVPFLHEDTIPGSPWVPTAAQFLGDFTLAEVARAQIRADLHGDNSIPAASVAWQQAGYLKTAEEFRLLYVAMTRAKRLLWMSAEQKGPYRWSIFTGNSSDNLQQKQPSTVLSALKSRFPQSVVELSAMGT
jgi:superfamily I DNA/RNA helicase